MATQDQRAFRLATLLLTVALGLGWVVTRAGSAATPAEPPSAPVDLAAEIPTTLGSYTSRPIAVTEGVADQLAAAGFLFRAYEMPGEPVVWVWVGYYANQRDATVHSPTGCYAGVGWSTDAAADTADGGGGPAWDVRWLRVKRDTEERLVLYWYETRDGAVGSELQRNWRRLRGRLQGGTELVFVRISTPEHDSRAARRRLVDIANRVRPYIRARMARANPAT